MDVSLKFNDMRVRKAFKTFRNKGGNIEHLLEQTGELVEHSTFDRHKAGRNVDGSKFPALSTEYERRKRPNGGRVLIRKGNMLKTVTWQMRPSGRTVRVGYGDEKARYHMSDEPRSKMPLRNPLGVSKEDAKEIENLSEDLLQMGD